MDLHEHLDTVVYYENHKYDGAVSYALGWYVSYNPSGSITQVLSLIDDGEWRDVTEMGPWQSADFAEFVTGNPPDDSFWKDIE